MGVNQVVEEENARGGIMRPKVTVGASSVVGAEKEEAKREWEERGALIGVNEVVLVRSMIGLEKGGKVGGEGELNLEVVETTAGAGGEVGEGKFNVLSGLEAVENKTGTEEGVDGTTGQDPYHIWSKIVAASISSGPAERACELSYSGPGSGVVTLGRESLLGREVVGFLRAVVGFSTF